MKKRNTLRALGALVIFTVLGLLSACESFSPYEPKGGRIEFFEADENDDGPFITVIVIKSSKLPDYSIVWTPETVTATTDNGIPFGNDGPIRSTTTLIFTGPGIDDLFITLKDDWDNEIYKYPPEDSEPDTDPDE